MLGKEGSEFSENAAPTSMKGHKIKNICAAEIGIGGVGHKVGGKGSRGGLGKSWGRVLVRFSL